VPKRGASVRIPASIVGTPRTFGGVMPQALRGQSKRQATNGACHSLLKQSTKKELMEIYRQLRGQITAKDFTYVVNSDNF
jgi:hypothetical protein